MKPLLHKSLKNGQRKKSKKGKKEAQKREEKISKMRNIFKDKQGKTIIAQWPNLPLTVWFFSFIISLLQIHNLVTQLASAISFGALFTWAWMEIFSGVNTFRRILGAVIMAFILWGTITT